LYHFEACPFCLKVRREIKRLGLSVELRDIKRSRVFHDQLMKGGGEYQVPCLKIPGQPEQWMYESSDINAYLNSRFGA
jgi:glutathione S-transferase